MTQFILKGKLTYSPMLHTFHNMITPLSNDEKNVILTMRMDILSLPNLSKMGLLYSL
jgi:hypothetical protein